MAHLSRRKLRAYANSAPAVPYRWQRPQFRSGDLIAQSHGDWHSWSGIQVIGVRAFTLSTYSHVGVIWVDPADGGVYVFEAVSPCVRKVRLSSIGSFYHLPMAAHWSDYSTAFAEATLGTPYSKLYALAAFFAPLPSGVVSQCAALSREIMIRAGVDLGRMSRPDSVVQSALALGSSLTFIRNEKQP